MINFYYVRVNTEEEYRKWESFFKEQGFDWLIANWDVFKSNNIVIDMPCYLMIDDSDSPVISHGSDIEDYGDAKFHHIRKIFKIKQMLDLDEN